LGQDAPSTQAYELLLATFPTAVGAAGSLLRSNELAQAEKYPKLSQLIYERRLGAPDVAVRAQIQVGVCEVQTGQYAEAVETLLAPSMRISPT